MFLSIFFILFKEFVNASFNSCVFKYCLSSDAFGILFFSSKNDLIRLYTILLSLLCIYFSFNLLIIEFKYDY